MSKFLRYSDKFLSRAGVVWRIEIWQEADKPFSVKGFDCEAGEALLIEWSAQPKEAVVCGSTATLQLESPGDRTYIDLYTINPGDIRLDVYREENLFWSGLLDPEFYEEPYERAANYPVSLTFSDFGILDRLKYNLEGNKTIHEVLTDAIQRAGLNIELIDTSLISTYIDDSTTVMKLSDIAVNSANWFDEDGEASTLREVLESMLQPLGLRIIQRAGKIWTYDLNALYNSADRKQIDWSGDSSTLSVDKVFNNVKITFSPYGDSTLADYSLDVEDVPQMANPVTIPVYEKENTSTGRPISYNGFKLSYSNNAKTKLKLDWRSQFFRIDPEYTQESCAGVIWGFKYNDTQYLNEIKPLFPTLTQWSDKIPPKDAISTVPIIIFSTPLINFQGGHVVISGDRPGAQTKDRLLLNVDILADFRQNPFEDADEHNDQKLVDDAKTKLSVMWIPVKIQLKDANGQVTHHYNNSHDFYQPRADKTFRFTQGYWQEGAALWGDAFLAFYPDDPKNELAIGGWKTNRRMISRGIGDIPTSITRERSKDGEYITLPPAPGIVEVQIGSNIHTIGIQGVYWNWTDKLKWLAYKDFSIELVNSKGEKIQAEDVEYSGYINKAAKESLELSTLCGTCKDNMMSARAIYLSTLTGKPIETFNRADKEGECEKLLIGTMYSQYATRHTTLSGEVYIDTQGLNTYTEVNQDNKVFIMSGEVMNVFDDTTDATFIELSPDEYDAIEEVN